MPLPRIFRYALGLTVAALLPWVMEPAMAPAAGLGPVAGPAVRSGPTEVIPGVTYQRIVERGPRRKIFLLTFDPSVSSGSLDVGLAASPMPGYATVSRMATRDGAVAAINGDFGLWPGRPAHAYADDGVLLQTPVVGLNGRSFALSADEADRYLGMPSISIRVFRYSKSKSWRVDRWNEGRPGSGDVVAFTPMGGSIETPPKRACSARLLPAGKPSFSSDQMAIEADYTVDAVRCSVSPMPLHGGIVLAAKRHGTGAKRVTNLDKGETVSLSWSYGWRDVLDSIGGGPVLLQNGKIMVSHCEKFLCGRAPRTAIGVTADGKILLMVVDGRRLKWSVGMDLREVAVFLKSMGAVDAINLDGGGSSEMWVNGQVMNRPSDGHERRVSSSVLILPGAGSTAPLPLTSEPRRPSPLDLMADRRAWRAAMNDPASTGGLLGTASG